MAFDFNMRVLVIDDSALIRARIASILESATVHVVGEGTTAQACIQGILATRPDVVVLDVQLEQGTGLQVLRAGVPAAAASGQRGAAAARAGWVHSVSSQRSPSRSWPKLWCGSVSSSCQPARA